MGPPGWEMNPCRVAPLMEAICLLGRLKADCPRWYCQTLNRPPPSFIQVMQYTPVEERLRRTFVPLP